MAGLSTLSSVNEDIPRGFKSSQDAKVCWYVYRDRKGKLTYSIHCLCGLERPLKPDSDGLCAVRHKVLACGWTAKVFLVDFDLLFISKSARRASGR